MCLCKKVNQSFLGSNPNYGKAIKLTPTKYQSTPVKKTVSAMKKYVNGKLQM